MAYFPQLFNDLRPFPAIKNLLRDRWLLALAAAALLIRLWASVPAWVEGAYANGLYPGLSRAFRALLGWLPISVGDLLYAAAFLYLLTRAWKLVRLLRQRAVDRLRLLRFARKALRMALLVYVWFNLGWGLNYDRQGIAHQLHLRTAPRDTAALFRLAGLLKERLNEYARRADPSAWQPLSRNRDLYQAAADVYGEAKNVYPFLAYPFPSLKSSLFSFLGHYVGFTGYYNPFSGEAQVKSDIPHFLKPFVATHEIAHQLGYARESEASFVAFLACRASTNAAFRYSVYFELYREVMAQCARVLPAPQVAALQAGLHPRIGTDQAALADYLARSRNRIEPLMSAFYDRYLRLNRQPAGLGSYSQVVRWLLAYRERFGDLKI